MLKYYGISNRGGADLHCEVVAGVAASVDDVEGRHWQHLFTAAFVIFSNPLGSQTWDGDMGWRCSLLATPTPA